MKQSLRTVTTALLVLHALNGCGDNRTAENFLTNAQQYRAQGNAAAAAIELKNALQLEPDNAQARLQLGEAYLDQFQLAAAEKEFRRAMALQDSHQARLLLARTLFYQQKFQEILEDIPDEMELSSPELDYLRLVAMHHLNRPGVDVLTDRLRQVATSTPYAKLANTLELARGRRFEEASIQVREVLAGSPDMVYALELDGNLSAALQETDVAIADYRKLVSLVPVSYYYKLILAGLLTDNKDYQEALPVVNELLKVLPNQAQGNYYRAVIAYNNDELKLAAEHVDKALASFPEHFPARLLSGVVHYRLGQFEQANNALEPISNQIPADHPAKRLWAAIQLQLGDDEQAFKALEDVSEFSQQDADLVAAVGAKLAQTGHYDDAVHLLRKVLPQDETGRIQSQLGMTLVMSGESTEGLKELEDLVAEQPDLGRAQMLLFNGYLKAGEYAKAQRQVDEIRRKEGDTPAVSILQGIVAGAAGKLDTAKQHFTHALKLDPDYQPAHIYLAKALLLEAKPQQAREHYLAVVAKAPNQYAALKGLVDTAAREPELQETLGYLQQASTGQVPGKPLRFLLSNTYFKLKQWNAIIELYPDVSAITPMPLSALFSVEEYPMLARAYQMTGKDGLALSVLRHWVEAQPDSGVAHYNLGMAFYRQRNMFEAESQLTDALRLQPDSALVQLSLAKVQLINGKLDNVGQLLPQLEQRIPNQPDFLRLKGSWLVAKGNLPAAIKSFEQLYTLASTETNLLLLADTLWRSGRTESAVKLLETSLEVPSDSGKVLLMLANYQLQQRQYQDAAKRYQQVLEMQPDSLVAANNLAWILNETGQAQKALSIIQPAVKRWPDDANLLDTYGVILLENAMYRDAVDALQRAVNKLPDNPSVQFHYAKALSSVQRKEYARLVLQKIVSGKQEFPEKTEAKQLLEELQSL